jgi:hypothetical protein
MTRTEELFRKTEASLRPVAEEFVRCWIALAEELETWDDKDVARLYWQHHDILVPLINVGSAAVNIQMHQFGPKDIAENKSGFLKGKLRKKLARWENLKMQHDTAIARSQQKN